MTWWRGWRTDFGVLTVGVIVFVLDQLTKEIVVRTLSVPEPRTVPVLGDWFRLTYVTNAGAAFGMLQGWTIFFALVAIVVVPLIFYYNRQLVTGSWLVRLCPGLLLGGTLGNFVDRVRQGYVVDFLDAGIGALRWPAFNVADAAFVVGTAVLAFYLMRTGETQERRGPETATGSADGGGGAA